jgi:RNA polymerase sigma-70 factor (ECF subfamily)
MTRQRSDVDDVPGEDSAEGHARWTSLASAMARAVRRQCPAWLASHAEDIAQVALTKVIAMERQREGLQPFTSFYLHRVAHSALVDEIRRRRRRPEVSLDSEIEPGEHAAVTEPPAAGNPETEAAARELGVAIRDCLSAATRDRRLAVSLYLQGHTVPEAARVLGWSAKRAENLVYRGLAALRECLLRKGHKP